MNSDLMGATGPGDGANQTKLAPARMLESIFNEQMRLSRCTGRDNALLQPDRKRLMLPESIQRLVYNERIPFRPAPHNRQVFFADTILLHQKPEPPRCRRGF